MKPVLEVWGVSHYEGRRFVAAKSKAEAARLCGDVSISHMNSHASKTRNPVELYLALLYPGCVFKQGPQMQGDFMIRDASGQKTMIAVSQPNTIEQDEAIAAFEALTALSNLIAEEEAARGRSYAKGSPADKIRKRAAEVVEYWVNRRKASFSEDMLAGKGK